MVTLKYTRNINITRTNIDTNPFVYWKLCMVRRFISVIQYLITNQVVPSCGHY
jgi:hypothetical protein